MIRENAVRVILKERNKPLSGIKVACLLKLFQRTVIATLLFNTYGTYCARGTRTRRLI